MLTEDKAVLAGAHKIATATIGKSNHRTASGKRFNRGDAKGFEARENEGAGILETGGELVGRKPR